jgi:hypothetical protein
MRQHPEMKKNLVDLLIGNVFRDGVEDIFTPMSEWVMIPQSIPLDVPSKETSETEAARA